MCFRNSACDALSVMLCCCLPKRNSCTASAVLLELISCRQGEHFAKGYPAPMGAWPADNRYPAFRFDTSAKYPLLATCSENDREEDAHVACAALDGQLSAG